jgi:ABC-2 type transport system permease protein
MIKLLNMNIPRVLNKKNRVLLSELTKTDFKLRYQGSVLGYLWALLRPLMMFAILYRVFAKLLRFGGDIPHYPVYLLAGTTMWSFFTECTSQGIQAMVIRGDLIRKISFPKYIVVGSATLTAVINMLINLVVVIIFALINGVTPSMSWLLVPLSLVELYVLSLGISFLLGAINVKYRDITSIWDVLTQALFYAVPIIYPLSLVAESSISAAKIILLNPIAQAIQDIRHNLITPETITTWNYISNPWLQFLPIILIIVILIFATLYFRKKSRFFAEEI